MRFVHEFNGTKGCPLFLSELLLSVGLEWGDGSGSGLSQTSEWAADEDSPSHGSQTELHTRHVSLQDLCQNVFKEDAKENKN